MTERLASGTLRAQAALYAAVATGAALGGIARALVSAAGAAFPAGTLGVNIVGSFLIGLYAGLTAPGGRLSAGTCARHFVTTGFCGGFTTFSMFSLETVRFAADGAYALAATHAGGSVAAWLAAVWAGDALATRFNRLGR